MRGGEGGRGGGGNHLKSSGETKGGGGLKQERYKAETLKEKGNLPLNWGSCDVERLTKNRGEKKEAGPVNPMGSMKRRGARGRRAFTSLRMKRGEVRNVSACNGFCPITLRKGENQVKNTTDTPFKKNSSLRHWTEGIQERNNRKRNCHVKRCLEGEVIRRSRLGPSLPANLLKKKR